MMINNKIYKWGTITFSQMALLTLEQVLEQDLFTVRIFNRLKKMEERLQGNGHIGTLASFLFDQYHNKSKPITQIVRDLESDIGLTTSHGRLREYMVALGITILSRSEAQSGTRNPRYGRTGVLCPLFGRHLSEEAKTKLSMLRSGRSNPFFGKTHTQENRFKMALATKGKTWEEMNGVERAEQRKKSLSERQKGERSNFYGKKGSASYTFGKTQYNNTVVSHGGVRADIGYFVRSTWEANLARVFMYLGEPFQYEPERFTLEITPFYREVFPDQDKTTYLPDFKNGHYYEVKGTFDTTDGLKTMAKLLMFMEQYGAEIEIVDRPRYKLLEKEFKDKIDADPRFCGWETPKDNLKTNPGKFSAV
jgi:hypothetical protein